ASPAAMRDTPYRKSSTGAPITVRRLGADLAGAWRHPGTRLGLWSPFTTQFTGTVFALMVVFAFVIAGGALDGETASSLLRLFVLAGMAAGPMVGLLVQRHPLRR